MHTNSSLEWEYIRKMTEINNQIKKQQIESGLYSLKPGDRVRVHLNYSKTSNRFEKRRMNFDQTGTFVKYLNGNAIVELDRQIDGKKIFEIPIYFVSKIYKNKF